MQLRYVEERISACNLPEDVEEAGGGVYEHWFLRAVGAVGSRGHILRGRSGSRAER